MEENNITPLNFACLNGNIELVRYLVEELHCDIESNTLSTIHVACAGGQIEVIRYLVEELHCDINVRDTESNTLLHTACDQEDNNIEVVRYLVEELHCEINVTNDKGKTPLEVTSNSEVVAYLESLQQSSTQPGTPLNEQDSDALHKLLQSTKVKLESSQLTLKAVQQLLGDHGHKELAANLRAKLNEVIEEQQQYINCLEDLMSDKDTLELRYLKVFLVGPPGVGKTTTLNRLLKSIVNISSSGDECRSTLLANCIQVLAFVADNAAEWLSSKDVDEETKLLFAYLRGNKTSSVAKEEKEMPSIKPKVVHVEHKHKEGVIPSKDTRQLPQQAPSTEVPKTTKKSVQSQSKLIPIKARLQKLIANGDYSKMAKLLGNTLLNINDIGGQPGFLEMLPALSTGPAMYLVFLNVSKDLCKPYKIPFSRDATIITPFNAIHTVEATISQIFSAIASVHTLSPDTTSYPKAATFSEKFEKFQQVKPVAALIGTHKDKLDDPAKEIKQIDEALKQVTQKFKKILVSPHGSDASFFTVDNYTGTEQSDIGPVRDFMNKIFSSHFKEASLPIRPKWLIFGTMLRREYKVVKIEDCLEIGKMLEMDEKELKFCIWYLACIGTLMHYTNIAKDEDNWFKNHVICSPQVIFDSISQLIITSLRTLHSEGYVIEEEREELLKKGQFSIDSIEKYCYCDEVTERLDKDELIPAKQLVKLLNHVNLLSPIIHKEADGDRVTYLMPAVLECATLDELTTPPQPDANNPEPLLITFSCGYVPTGTFCGMITQLVSRGPDEILGLVWDLVEDGVKRNLVSFYIDYVNKVTLICHDRCYEIRVSRDDPDMSLKDLCAHVMSVILHLLKDLYINLSPQIAFRCPCPKHATSREITNVCTLLDIKKMRFLCDRRPIKLIDAHQVWLGNHILQYLIKDGTREARSSPVEAANPTRKSIKPTPQASGGLTLKDVKKITNEARFKWLDIGIELDLDVDILKDIRSRNHYVVDDCFTEMLSHWLGRPSPPPTWSMLAMALRSPAIGRHDIAGAINLDSEPITQLGGFTLKEVRQVIWEVRSQWRDLGTELDFDIGTLNAIRDTKHHVVDDCFTEMLICWFKCSSPPPTWSELVRALNSSSVSREDIAREVEAKWSSL